jgi:hypothetical protein
MQAGRLGAVEGLAAGLVEVMQAALEALAAAGHPTRSSYSSLAEASASPWGSPQQQPPPGLQARQVPEAAAAALQLQRYALLWSLAALAALCRSPPVAARVAALAGLPAALTAALRFRELRIHLYACGGWLPGLVGSAAALVSRQAALLPGALHRQAPTPAPCPRPARRRRGQPLRPPRQPARGGSSARPGQGGAASGARGGGAGAAGRRGGCAPSHTLHLCL